MNHGWQMSVLTLAAFAADNAHPHSNALIFLFFVGGALCVFLERDK